MSKLYIISFHQVLSVTMMSTEMSQVGEAPSAPVCFHQFVVNEGMHVHFQAVNYDGHSSDEKQGASGSNAAGVVVGMVLFIVIIAAVMGTYYYKNLSKRGPGPGSVLR